MADAPRFHWYGPTDTVQNARTREVYIAEWINRDAVARFSPTTNARITNVTSPETEEERRQREEIEEGL